jgi:hypothetical protein
MNRLRPSEKRLFAILLDRRSACLCLILSLWAAGGGTAWGAGAKETQQQRATRARKACLSGDYQKGVDILTELFVESKDPVIIFNQGRCFEQSSRYEDAISRFEEYLRVTKNTGAKDREDAKEHIVDCQAKLDKGHAVAPPPAAASVIVPPPAAMPTIPQPQVALEPAVSVVEVPTSEPASSGGGLRIAGIVVGSVGVAALGSAIVLNHKANTMAKDLESPTGYSRSKLDDRKTYETMAWIGYGVGAACLAGGAILYAVGVTKQSSPVALLPALAPEYAGLNVQGAF